MGKEVRLRNLNGEILLPETAPKMIYAEVRGDANSNSNDPYAKLRLYCPELKETDTIRVFRKIKTISRTKYLGNDGEEHTAYRRKRKSWKEARTPQIETPLTKSELVKVKAEPVLNKYVATDGIYELLFKKDIDDSVFENASKFFMEHYVDTEIGYVSNGAIGKRIDIKTGAGEYSYSHVSVNWGIQIFRNGYPITMLMPFKFVLNGMCRKGNDTYKYWITVSV